MRISQVLAGMALIGLAAGFTARAQDAGDARLQLPPAQEAEFRRLVDQQPPAGASYEQLNEFFRSQDLAARRLGEPAARETILRRWVKDVPNNETPRWTLWRHLMGLGKRAEAFEMAESVVRTTPQQFSKVRAASWLAGDYVNVGNLPRAQALLAGAETIVKANFYNERMGSDVAFWFNSARAALYFGQCNVSLKLQETAKALEQCRLADEHSRLQMAAASLVSPFERTGGAQSHMASVYALAEAQLRAGRPYDAELTARRAVEIANGYGIGPLGRSHFYIFSSRARLLQHDYAGAEKVSKEARATAGDADSNPKSSFSLTQRMVTTSGLAGQGRWDEAQAVLDVIDKDTQGDPLAQARADDPLLRGTVGFMTGRQAAAAETLRAALLLDEERFGADHLITGFTRGLYGVALASGQAAAPQLQSQALAELTRAAASITASSSLGEDYSDAGLRRMYRRMVLEKYLELATAGAIDAQAASATFGVADYLRGSSVQLALSEAAARSAAGTAGLADVVRRDQDASHELQALYGFITQQTGRAEGQRVEGVVTQMKQRIAELERSRVALRADIARQFPQYDQLIHPRPPSTEQVRALLGEGDVFVSLLPTGRFVHVWAVSKSGGAYHRADLDEATLQGLVQRLRKTLDTAGSASPPRFDAQAASRLHEALLQPLAAILQGARHLVFAPGGVLAQVPMGVLLTQPWSGTDPAQAPWLVKQAAVSHVVSASAWMSINNLARAAPAGEALAAWGDPLFDRSRAVQPAAGSVVANSAARSLLVVRSMAPADATSAPRAALNYASIPALPETREEIEGIAASLNASAANDALFGDKATRESVLASSRSGALAKKRVIVFATHGLIAGDVPNLTQPALAMAANGQEQANPLAPLLTLEDVLTLKLNADWVVLSACNTAAADGKADEALSGLARGFFYAGSRSLLVTHWAVDSDSARLLTTATFEHYAREPQALKAESLRQAMLKVMAMPKYAHPAFWAPYALVGDGGRGQP